MVYSDIYLVSKKRILLSWYVDLLLFLTAWELLVYFLNLQAALPFWLPFILLFITRALLSKLIGSPGLFFLSIDKDTMEVDRNISNNENWCTILIGIMSILGGCKQLVRWTEFNVIYPQFGSVPGDTIHILTQIVYGSLFILAGYWFLKLNIKGFFLSVAALSLQLISTTLSWDLWKITAFEMVIERRTAQGLPIRNGEIEFMQAYLPTAIVTTSMMVIIAMLFTYKNFKQRSVAW